LQCTGLDCTCQLACSGSVVQRSDGTLWSYYSTLAPVTDASDTKIVATSFSAYYETYGSSGLGCYVDSGSHVWCWGANSEGQLGNASQSQTASSVPVEVVTDTTGTPLANITSVAVDSAEGYLACAIDTSTDVWCWGYGSNGVQGSGYTYNNPYASQVVTNSSMTPFSGAVSLAVTYDHVCATVIGSNGAGGPYQLWCWGSNNYGQIGVGSTTTTSYNYPQYVSNLYSSVAQVSVSEYVTCAVTSDSSVWCWGYNGYGTLGNGLTTGNAYVPAQVQLSTADAGTPTYFTGAASVQLGGYYYGSPCARKTDGSLWCWGEYSSSASYLPQPYVQSQVPVRQTFALCPNGYGSDPSYIDLTGSFNESGSKVSTQISCP
jgi:alpha-tubulin suppressor-like RCC1 family protein